MQNLLASVHLLVAGRLEALLCSRAVQGSSIEVFPPHSEGSLPTSGPYY